MKLICISAGHTNNPKDDRGAIGNGFIEGVETVKLRDEVARILRSQGLSVIEDGADGISEPLRKAIVLARQSNVAIEFHFNAGVPKATGIEILAKPKQKSLAQRLGAAIQKATGLTLRGERGWKLDSSGQHPRLAFCEAGGLIVEVAFISNANDMKAYKDYFQKICVAVADVLANA